MAPASPARTPDRKELTGPALRSFFRIAVAWELEEAEQMRILGLDGRSTFQSWKRGGTAAISRDALERISYVLGIYKGVAHPFARESRRMAAQAQPQPAVRRPIGARADDLGQRLRSVWRAPICRCAMRPSLNFCRIYAGCGTSR